MFGRLVILLVISLGVCLTADAQKPLRFGTGVFFGYNLAQIDGDDMQGYDKPGINFGLRGIAFLYPKLELHTELSYSQQGSQSKNFRESSKVGRRLNLDYGGITALVAINDWFQPVKEYYRFQLTTGVSLKRIVKIDYEDIINGKSIGFDEIWPYISSTDFALVIGSNFKVSHNLGVSFRYNRSFSKILDAEEVRMYFERKTINSMKGYFLSANIFYHF